MGRRPNKFRVACLEPEAQAIPPQTSAAVQETDDQPGRQPGSSRGPSQVLGQALSSLIRPGRPRNKSKRKQEALNRLQAQQQATVAGRASSPVGLPDYCPKFSQSGARRARQQLACAQAEAGQCAQALQAKACESRGHSRSCA